MGSCKSVPFIPPLPQQYQLPAPDQTSPSHFTVVSINVLNEQHYARFAKCPRMDRMERTTRMLHFFSSLLERSGKDVSFIALQEANPERLAPLVDLLESEGFGILFSADPKSGMSDLVALAYRRSRFVPVGHLTVHDFACEEKPSSCSKAIVMSLFEEVECKKKVAVASIHMPWVTSESDKEQLLQQVDKLCSRSPHGNYVFAGDFNLDSNVAGDAAVMSRVLGMDALYGSPTHSSHSWLETTRSVTATAQSPHGAGPTKIDYVLMRGQLKLSTRCESCYTLPSDANLLLMHSGSESVKEQAFFSDHAAVVSSFEFV